MSKHIPTQDLIDLAAEIDDLTGGSTTIASAIFTETAQKNAGRKLRSWS